MGVDNFQFPWAKSDLDFQTGRTFGSLEAQIPEYFNRPSNIGIVLGEASDGLVDIDLDCVEALTPASVMLPGTNLVWPRQQAQITLAMVCPRSRSFDRIQRFTYQRCASRIARGWGRQTLFPGSIHPSGECIEWDIDGEQSVIDYETLKIAATRLAARCLIRRYLPEVTDNASLLKALEISDRRLSRQIRHWLNLPERADLPRPNNSFPQLDGDRSFPWLGPRPPWLKRGCLIPKCLLAFARSDLDECVRELQAQTEPGRANLLYKKSIWMGAKVARGEIDADEVETIPIRLAFPTDWSKRTDKPMSIDRSNWDSRPRRRSSRTALHKKPNRTYPNINCWQVPRRS